MKNRILSALVVAVSLVASATGCRVSAKAGPAHAGAGIRG